MAKRPQPKSAFKEAENKINKIHSSISNGEMISEIPIDLIESPKTHDRQCYTNEEIESLAKSIRTSGLLQPIIVRKQGDKFERLVGFKRLLAQKLNNEAKIKAIVLENISNEDAALITISENLFRSNPNAYDQTLAFVEYVSIATKTEIDDIKKILNKVKASRELNDEEKEISDFIANVAKEKLSITISSLANKIKLLDIKNILVEAIQNKEIDYLQAITLDKIDDTDKLTSLLEKTISEKLTLKELKNIVSKAQKKNDDNQESNQKDYTKILSAKTKRSISKLKEEDKKRVESYLEEINKIITKD